MNNSYRYFENRECEYFPCHKINKDELFNCLFCYCPLYFLEECGGNYEMYKGIKDCSNCKIPHSYNGYDHINNTIRKHNESIIER